jgi:hypothetical protein
MATTEYQPSTPVQPVTRVTLLDAVTANGNGSGEVANAGDKTLQCWASTDAGGGGAATVQFQGSNDNEHWVNIGASQALAPPDASTHDTKAITSTDRFAWVRAVVSGIAGTGTAVSAVMCS